jgi:hypothetical protein
VPHSEATCDLKKILARFGKKKLARLKAEMPINSCLIVRQQSIVWKKKLDIITEMEEETGHKYDRLEKIIQLRINQCSQKKSLSNGATNLRRDTCGRDWGLGTGD